MTRTYKIVPDRRVFAVISLALFLTGISVVPHRWCGREANEWFQGKPQLHEQLARGVEHWVTNQLAETHFRTGSDLFNGEWLFGTYFMAGMGYGQIALEEPERRVENLRRMEKCIERLMSEPVRAFDHASWKEDAIDSLDGENGHAAYLGYANLLLSFHRWHEPNSKFADLNDRITASLTRRLQRSPFLLLETYPRELYPVDNCAVVASIGLHARVTGRRQPDLMEPWMVRLRANYLDSKTGLLIQAVDSATGQPSDGPRGSGTCLGQYFLSFLDPTLARELHAATKRHLFGTLFGFGMVREYPAHVRGGRGDIDSGPIFFGYGLSATGFSIAGSRQYGDKKSFVRLYSTAHLFGAPILHDGRRNFVTGGPLGDAIMFAMLTAQPSLQARKP